MPVETYDKNVVISTKPINITNQLNYDYYNKNLKPFVDEVLEGVDLDKPLEPDES